MTSRLLYTVFAVVATAATSHAQSNLPSAPLQSGLPSAPLQSGLRSASLPDRPPTMPPPNVDRFRARRHTYAPRPFPRRHPGRKANVGFGYGYGPFIAAPEQEIAEEVVPNGFIHLQMQPGNAEVHIDGLYMGTVDDFRRLIPGRSLEAGEHRVELRANGYESATFTVLISPNETVTYRSDLKAAAAAPERPRSAVTLAEPKTFYVIPGCYAGDRPPQKARLRAGCDASKLRKIPPVVGVMARAQR
jgi:hypothetical protein